jgi:hypothetical protein
MFEFGFRNTFTQLRTSEPGQAVSVLTTSPKVRIQGEVDGAFNPATDWTILLNDEVLGPEAYLFNVSSAFLEVYAPRNSGVFNVTIVLGPTFTGTLGIKGVVCTTITDRPRWVFVKRGLTPASRRSRCSSARRATASPS